MMNYHSCQDDGKVFKCWKFFNSKSGLEVFQIDNNFTPKVKDDGAAEGEQPKEYRFIGLQPKEKRMRKEKKDFEYELSEYGSEQDDEDDDSGPEDSDPDYGEESGMGSPTESDYDDEDYSEENDDKDGSEKESKASKASGDEASNQDAGSDAGSGQKSEQNNNAVGEDSDEYEGGEKDQVNLDIVFFFVADVRPKPEGKAKT